MDGILNVNKPVGPTSHDVVARLRRTLRPRKIGHAGTLDPAAEGVLLICLGNATRVVEYLMDLHKKYRAVAAFGVETDSEDATGTITKETDASNIDRESLAAVLPRFTGRIMQIPPMVSAVHHQGTRLYKLARAGETVEREPRRADIYSLDLIDFESGTKAKAVLEVECSRGTYIRTLCADIGQALGCGGHMSALCRTAIGPFDIGEALSVETIEEAHSQGTLSDLIIPIDKAISDMPSIAVTESDMRLVLNGVEVPSARLSVNDLPENGTTVRIHSPDKQLLGIGMISALPSGELSMKPAKIFPIYD